MGKKNKNAPLVGGMVKMRNGMTGEIIGVGDDNREELEVLVDGTRCYVEARDVKVLGVLDRIAAEISKED